jgi:hypothetical protein
MSESSQPRRTHRPSDDYARALRFVFDDPAWVPKTLIGALFTLLSVFFIGSIWVSGYTVGIVRRTVGGERRPLPEWNNWGELFRDGLRATVVWLAHIFPLMLLAILMALALGGAGTILSSSLDTPSDFQTALFLMVMTGTIFFSLVGLAILLYLPAAFLRFIILDQVSAAFDFRENIAFIRRNMNSYFQALMVFFVASFIAQFGLVVFCIGFFPAAFWSVCVFGYAMGKLALEDEQLTVSLTNKIAANEPT